jgi:hypothetical protein
MRSFVIRASAASAASGSALLLLMGVGPCRVGAQVPARDSSAAIPRARLRIIGTFDEISGDVLAGVEVSGTATGAAVMTSSTGSANLALIVPNGGEIRLRKIGFEDQTLTVSMTLMDTVPISVMMKHVAELPAVVTSSTGPTYRTPALRGFEARRKTAQTGYFIPDSVLRKEESRSLGSVLAAHVPGVGVRPAASASFLLQSPQCVNGGPPDVYIDGVIVGHMPDVRWQPQRKNAPPQDPRLVPIDLNQFQVSTLAGVEFYPDNTTIPAEFGHPVVACGALFLWTRERS